MRKVIVLHHEAYEINGTLNPLLKSEGFRVRYVNFMRQPDAQATLEKYDGLVILGGYMGVYEADKYSHLKVEMDLVEQALKKNVPVLGICLGSQIIAHVLGANVRKHKEREMGWCEVHLTDQGAADPLLEHFSQTERVFQSHGDTFDIPTGAEHLAWSKLCESQAFRYGEKVYGLQFHLESDQAIIDSWLQMPENKEVFKTGKGKIIADNIESDTRKYLARSLKLSHETFIRFLKLFGEIERNVVLGSAHGKSSND
jgi:GMP synthase (glutamine-hydrolysing)